MTLLLLVGLLINGHPYELVREMPNMDVCEHVMHMLEDASYVYSTECRSQPFE